MLDQLINLVKEHAGEAIVKNPAIPNEHNDAAINETASGIFDSLKSQISEGGISSITNLLQGNNLTSNPMVSNIIQSVSGKLMQKFNLDSGAAGNIVQSLIPSVMNKFVAKTNDPSDSSFTLESITSAIGGGGLGNILGSFSGLFGK